MSQKVTGTELISALEKSCKKLHKLFIPDSPRQESVANALVEHYDGDTLIGALELYVKSKPGPFLMFDFAIESRVYVETIKKEQASINKFRDLVKQTQERLAEE